MNNTDWIEEEIHNLASDAGITFDAIEFPWEGDPFWDPSVFARRDLVAVLRDEKGKSVGEVRFRIIVNPDYGKEYEYLWIVDEESVEVVRKGV